MNKFNVRKVLRFFVINILLSALFSCAKEDDESPSWLFVQTGTLQSYSETQLQIHSTDEVFGFTDRPQRMHALWSNADFSAFWNSGQPFAAVPPNAVMTWEADNITQRTEILLTASSYADNVTTYNYKYEAGDNLTDQLSGTVSLFIDAVYTCGLGLGGGYSCLTSPDPDCPVGFFWDWTVGKCSKEPPLYDGSGITVVSKKTTDLLR